MARRDFPIAVAPMMATTRTGDDDGCGCNTARVPVASAPVKPAADFFQRKAVDGGPAVGAGIWIVDREELVGEELHLFDRKPLPGLDGAAARIARDEFFVERVAGREVGDDVVKDLAQQMPVGPVLEPLWIPAHQNAGSAEGFQRE